MLVNLFCNARVEGFQPYLDSVALYLETNMDGLFFTTSATTDDDVMTSLTAVAMKKFVIVVESRL